MGREGIPSRDNSKELEMETCLMGLQILKLWLEMSYPVLFLPDTHHHLTYDIFSY